MDKLISVFQPRKKLKYLEIRLENCSEEKQKSSTITENTCFNFLVLAFSYENTPQTFSTVDEKGLFLAPRKSFSEWTKLEFSLAVMHKYNSYFKQFMWSLFLFLLAT